MRALKRGVELVASVSGVIDRDAAARLHRGGGDAVDDEAVLDHVSGLRKRRVGFRFVAVELDEADIVRAVVKHERRARLDRAGGVDDCGQRLVIDLDQFGGVGGLVIGLGHHEGDVIADPPDAVLHQRRKARTVHRRPVAALEPARHRQVAEARGRIVGAGEHAQHAGRALGSGGVDRADFRVRVRRAQHITECHARQDDVADIAPFTPYQPRILEPGHRLAHSEFTHCAPRVDSCRLIVGYWMPRRSRR